MADQPQRREMIRVDPGGSMARQPDQAPLLQGRQEAHLRAIRFFECSRPACQPPPLCQNDAHEDGWHRWEPGAVRSASAATAAELKTETLEAFNRYIRATEARSRRASQREEKLPVGRRIPSQAGAGAAGTSGGATLERPRRGTGAGRPDSRLDRGRLHPRRDAGGHPGAGARLRQPLQDLSSPR